MKNIVRHDGVNDVPHANRVGNIALHQLYSPQDTA